MGSYGPNCSVTRQWSSICLGMLRGGHSLYQINVEYNLWGSETGVPHTKVIGMQVDAVILDLLNN